MKKIILSEKSLYYGKVEMPKRFEINQKKLSADIISSIVQKTQFPFSKNLDMLICYLQEHIQLKYDFSLVQKNIFGHICKPREKTETFLQVDPVDLRHSPDYVLLYGVNVKDCDIKIFYNDNRRKGRSWDIPLNNNQFVMFPSNLRYNLTNNSDELSLILTMTFEYI